MAESSELKAKLAEIKRNYVSELPRRATALRVAWERTQAEHWAHAPTRELHRLVHSLSGSGATFGFDALSADAHALEVELLKLLQDPDADRAALASLFEALLAAVTMAAENTG